MFAFKRALALAFVLLLSACVMAPAPTAEAPVIFVLTDGFRADYLDRGLTPTLSELAAHGVRGVMRPAFPSASLPNHVTLVTGVRPDGHGMIYNLFQDPEIPGAVYGVPTQHARDVTDRDPRWWSEAVPIWVTAERQGVRTAPLFYVGSNVAIQGVQGIAWRDYPADTTSDARVDAALTLLDLPAQERPRFITLTFGEPDGAGHATGPDSPETNAAIASVDAAVARLVAGLRTRRLYERTALVIVADHGMMLRPQEQVVYLDDLLAPDTADFGVMMGPIAGIVPRPGREVEVEQRLLGAHPHLQCWRKGDLPAALAFGAHRRTPPILCLPEPGWIAVTRNAPPFFQNIRGIHGYDGAVPEMAALFVAHGATFREGVTLAPFDNVDVYPLLARLLGVTPEPNDGDPATFASALRQPSLRRGRATSA